MPAFANLCIFKVNKTKFLQTQNLQSETYGLYFYFDMPALMFAL